MVELYFKQLKSKWFLLFIVITVFMNYYFFINSLTGDTTLENWIVFGNFITIFVNNSFIVYSLNRVKLFQNIYDLCLLRINKDKYTNKLILIGLINLSIYFIVVYCLIIILRFHFIYNYILLIKYLFFTFMLFFIYEIIYIIVIMDKKKYFLLFIPFITNLAYHFIFISNWF